MKKRIVATLLSLCLVIGLLPVTAMAAEDDTATEPCTVNEGCTLDNGHEGKCVTVPAQPTAVELAAEVKELLKNESNAVLLADENVSGGIAWSIEGTTLTIKPAETPEDGYESGVMKGYASGGGKRPWDPPKAYNTSVTKIVIRDGVTRLGSFAFMSMSGVTEVVFPNSLNSYAQGAFQGCSKLSGTIHLDADFEDFATEVFVSTQISSFTVDENNPNYTVKDDILYSKDGTVLINCPPAKEAAFNPDWLNGVTKIAPYAFRTCDKLTGTLIIPSNITSIGNQAFQNCKQLSAENFVIPDTVKEIDLTYTFANCAFTGTVTLPSHLTEIQRGAFNGCQISGIDWNGAKIKTIGNNVFQGMTVKPLHWIRKLSPTSVRKPSAILPLSSVIFLGRGISWESPLTQSPT